MELGAAQRARQKQAEKAARDQRFDDPLGQLTLCLDLISGVGQQRRQLARTFHIVGAMRLGGAQVE